MRGAALFNDLKERERQALQLHDEVVQGLVVAKMALDLDQKDQSREALAATLTSASQIINDLIGRSREDVTDGRRRPRARATGGPRDDVSSPDQPPIRVVLADDTSDIRLLLSLALELAGGFEVVGEAADGAEAVAQATVHQPDVAAARPGHAGARRAAGPPADPRRRRPSALVVVLSGFGADAMGEEAVRLGAATYVQKGVNPTELAEQLRALVRDRTAAREAGRSLRGMDDLGHPVWDADNHYYEALDAFTRHLDPALGPRTVQWATIEGRQYHVLGGKVSRAVTNATFDPISKPGCLSEYFRGNPNQVNPLELIRDHEPIRPGVPRPGRPPAGARRAGPGRAASSSPRSG